MKRNEAIKIIENIINYGLIHYGSSSGSFQRNKTPYEILDALEKAGMKPPEIKVYDNMSTTDDLGNEYPGYPRIVNKWEPEDGM